MITMTEREVDKTYQQLKEANQAHQGAVQEARALLDSDDYVVTPTELELAGAPKSVVVAAARPTRN